MENELQENEEFQQLHSLLSSWNLLPLLDKLKEQHCFIPVLKVMKSHHIEKILSGVPVGLAILFEHQLESWRSKINLPLMPSTSHYLAVSPKPSLYSKATNHEFKEDLQLILMKSKNGQSLIEYYNKHQCFKEAQRKLLISTIAKPIVDINLKFSLGESYKLEEEILKLFPNEKILNFYGAIKYEFYRTCNRGRIYAKVCNLKSQIKMFLPESTTLTSQSSIDDSRKCSPLRFLQIENCNSALDVFKIWPEYTNANGIKMIDLDFFYQISELRKLA